MRPSTRVLTRDSIASRRWQTASARDLLLSAAFRRTTKNGLVQVKNRVFSRMVIVGFTCVCGIAPVEAQLNTQHIKEDSGCRALRTGRRYSARRVAASHQESVIRVVIQNASHHPVAR